MIHFCLYMQLYSLSAWFFKNQYRHCDMYVKHLGACLHELLGVDDTAPLPALFLCIVS